MSSENASIQDPRHNFAGQSAPTNVNDKWQGYSKGSFWAYNNRLFICMDNATGAALWLELGPGPSWLKVSFTHEQLAASALTNDIELIPLKAAAIVHAIKIKHSISFKGGLIASYQLSVGVAGALESYSMPFDVFQDPGDTVFALRSLLKSEDHANTTSLRLAAVSVGANLDQATQGAVDVWLLLSNPM